MNKETRKNETHIILPLTFKNLLFSMVLFLLLIQFSKTENKFKVNPENLNKRKKVQLEGKYCTLRLYLINRNFEKLCLVLPKGFQMQELCTKDHVLSCKKNSFFLLCFSLKKNEH